MKFKLFHLKISKLVKVKYLNLSDNRLIKLPDELGNLTNLIEMRVMNNH